MHGVFRDVKCGGRLVVKDVRVACDVNRQVRTAGEGLEVLAVSDALAGAMELRREIRRELRGRDGEQRPEESATGACVGEEGLCGMGVA